MYKVISRFYDLKNNEHLYEVGDIYPVEGYKVPKNRIKELKGDNPYDRAFIEDIDKNEIKEETESNE